MLQPGRSYNAGTAYRYGFNGKENDNDVKGVGNSVDFGERLFDPRIGRWLSVDPLAIKYPYESPYDFAGDNPILYIDEFGKELIITGSDEEFKRFRTVIEKKFSGLIEVKRNPDTKVVTLVVNQEMLKGPQGKANELLLAKIKKDNKVYKYFDKVISDPNTTRLKLVEGEDSKKVVFGIWRNGRINSAFQGIDMSDIESLSTSKTQTPVGAIVHELMEAFNDQVERGSPQAKDEKENNGFFRISHEFGKSAQKDVDGHDYFSNVMQPKADGSYQGVMVSGIKDKKTGVMNYTITTYDVTKDKQILNIKNYSGEVTIGDDNEIKQVKLGKEIK